MTGASRRLAVVRTGSRLGVYVRVSAVMGRGGDTFHSPEVQERAGRALVERLGGTVVAVYVDLDVSGRIAPSDRPGLGDALQDVRAGRLDGVVVYDLSRFSRDTASGLRELEEITAAGGVVHSTAETVDLSTPGGIFATTVQLAAAKLRSDETQKAWKATHAARFQQGKAHGTVPLGYQRVDGQVVHDPVFGPAIQQAYVEYAAGMVSQTQLARRWTALRGKRVWQATVSDVLRSPFYAGQVRLNGETRPGQHEPLVSEEAWDAVQRRLAELEAAHSPKQRSGHHSLVGLVVCDLCGTPLWRRSPGNGRVGTPGHYVLLRCRSAGAGLCDGIGNPRFSLVEQAVLDQVLRAAAGLQDDAAQRAARTSRQARAGVDVARLRSEIAGLEQAIGNAAGLLARGVLTELAYRGAVSGLEQSAAALREQLAGAEQVAHAPAPAALLSAAARLEELWPRMTPQERRAALGPFVAQVRVRPAKMKDEPVADRVEVRSLI